MSLAIGGSSAPASAPSKPPHGTQWIDVRDFGAVGDTRTDSGPAFQAAVDRLIALGGGTLFVPSAPGKYLVSKSIWVDADDIQIVGEGLDSCVQSLSSFPVFIFGIRRVQSHDVNGVSVSQVADASNRPDLYGKLENSVIPGPGSRWGYRTNGDSFVQFHAGPMSSGQGTAATLYSSDNWSETTKLTLDFCIEPPDGQKFPAGYLFGLGSQEQEPAPFGVVMSDSTTMRVYFRTSDFDQGILLGETIYKHRGFDFSLAGADLPYRIAVQIDHDNAACSAFVKIGGVRTQVPLSNQLNLANSGMFPYTPHSGLTFILNDHYPFMLGYTGLTAAYGVRTGVDLRVYGLRMSNTTRYQTNGPGTPQVRGDAPGTPVDDRWSYFGTDNHTICFMDVRDDPATSGRIVSVAHGGAVAGGSTTGLIMHSLSSPVPTVNNALKNISVEGRSVHGQVICLGALYEFTAENVKTTAGFQGIGSFNIEASYIIHLRNCSLAGADASYYGFMQIIYGRDILLTTSGRATIRTTGCDDDWTNVFVTGVSANVECFYKARGYGYGGTKSITNMNIDFEGYTISRAGIYCEMHPYAPQTTLVLKNIFFGTIGPAASMVQLKQGDKPYRGYSNACCLIVENMQAYADDYQAAIDVDGPLWYGSVDALPLRGKPFLHRQKWGPTSNIVMRDPKFTAPPNTFAWYAGSHVLEVRSPADGQFTEWRCVRGGTYGTSTPPVWLGLDPLTVSPNGLAAYVLNNAYATAALS